MTNFKRATGIYFLFALHPPHRRGLLKKNSPPQNRRTGVVPGSRW